MFLYLWLFVGAVVVSLVVTPVVRRVARRAGALDRPDGTRKFHPTPIPKLGGVGVLIAYMAVVYVGLFLLGDWRTTAAADLARRCFVPVLMILALGIVDDLFDVRPWMKLAVQVLAAGWICSYPDLRIHVLANPVGDPSILGALSIPVTIFWIVMVTNAFNIIDGMDGLASGIAFVATTTLLIASIQRGDIVMPLLVAPLGGALLGFLRYNFNPATIFLGDSGSLWLGFLLSVYSIAGAQKSSTAIAIAAPLLTLALPILETVTSTLRRFLSGRPIMQPDNGHIHHQLLRRGFSARRAAIVLYAGASVFGMASLFLTDTGNALVGITSVTLGIVAWMGIQQLGYSEFVEVGNAFKRGFLYQRRIIQNSIITRKLAEDLKACDSLASAWPLLVAVAERLDFARLELRLGSRYEHAAGLNEQNVVTWWAAARVMDTKEWSVISLHLMRGMDHVGELTMWRSRDADPLHSELSLFIETAADQLPRLVPARQPRREFVQETARAGG